MAQVLKKSHFAALVGVKPAAVSNWIRRQRLTAPALRSDGRINVDLARRQLGVTLDPVQRSIRASDDRRRSQSADPVSRPSAASSADVIDLTVSRQLLQARATTETVRAERMRRELESERGNYMLAADASAAWAKALSGFILEVENSLPGLVLDLAGKDRHAMLVTLRRWWRQQRADGASRNQALADAEPEYVADPDAGHGR